MDGARGADLVEGVAGRAVVDPGGDGVDHRAVEARGVGLGIAAVIRQGAQVGGLVGDVVGGGTVEGVARGAADQVVILGGIGAVQVGTIGILGSLVVGNDAVLEIHRTCAVAEHAAALGIQPRHFVHEHSGEGERAGVMKDAATLGGALGGSVATEGFVTADGAVADVNGGTPPRSNSYSTAATRTSRASDDVAATDKVLADRAVGEGQAADNVNTAPASIVGNPSSTGGWHPDRLVVGDGAVADNQGGEHRCIDRATPGPHVRLDDVVGDQAVADGDTVVNVDRTAVSALSYFFGIVMVDVQVFQGGGGVEEDRSISPVEPEPPLRRVMLRMVTRGISE